MSLPDAPVPSNASGPLDTAALPDAPALLDAPVLPDVPALPDAFHLPDAPALTLQQNSTSFLQMQLSDQGG